MLQKKARNKRIVFTCVPLVLLLIGFAYDLWLGSAQRIVSLVAAAALLFLYCLCIIRLIPQWQRAWNGEPTPPPACAGGKRSLRPVRMHPFFRILCFAVLTRLAVFVGVYLIYSANNGYSGGIFDLLQLWTPAGTQSTAYLTLAQSWYPASGELLSLLPFYPAAVQALNYVFSNTLVTALFVSNMAFVFSAWLVYELTLFDADRDTAMLSALWFCLLPGSLLLMLPTADSLFLLLCLCCMVLTRQRRYCIASLFGLFAAFTRLSGVLLLLPVAMELIADCIRIHKSDSQESLRKGQSVGRFFSLLLIPLGLVLYLLVNVQIAATPFAFVQHGAARLGFFTDAAGSTAADLLTAIQTTATDTIASSSIRLAALVLPLLLFLVAIPRLRSAYSAYFLLYYALCIGTMPMDASRLMMTAFPLCTAMAACFGRRLPRVLLTLLLLIAFAASVWAFAAKGWSF